MSARFFIVISVKYYWPVEVVVVLVVVVVLSPDIGLLLVEVEFVVVVLLMESWATALKATRARSDVAASNVFMGVLQNGW